MSNRITGSVVDSILSGTDSAPSSMDDADRRTIREDPHELTADELPLGWATRWQACSIDTPGPRQVSAFNKAWNKARSRAQAFDASDPDEGYTVESFKIGGGTGVYSLENATALVEFAAARDWKLNRTNAATVTKKLKAMAEELPLTKATFRPETDEEYAKRTEGAARMAAADAEREAARAARQATADEILKKRPANAQAAIVAEWRVDESDIMTDYFSSRVERSVVIGWRTGSREDFRQLRRAAAAYEPTADLDADEHEHRDNYAMGAGNYLGARYGGWRVQSCLVNDSGFAYLPSGTLEDGLPSATETAPTPETDTDAGCEIVEGFHKKRDCAIWSVVPTTYLERDAFNDLKASAKAHGGWYYKKFGGTPAGFHFTSEQAATGFASEFFNDTPETETMNETDTDGAIEETETAATTPPEAVLSLTDEDGTYFELAIAADDLNDFAKAASLVAVLRDRMSERA